MIRRDSIEKMIRMSQCLLALLYFLLAFSTTTVIVGLRTSLPQDKLLKGFNFFKFDSALSQELIDTAENAIREWTVTSHPCFFNQPEQKAIKTVFKDVIGIKCSFIGGYPQSESKLVMFERENENMDLDNENENDESNPLSENISLDDYIALINIEGNFLFEKATIDDFRSAVENSLGCSVNRQVFNTAVKA